LGQPGSEQLVCLFTAAFSQQNPHLGNLLSLLCKNRRERHVLLRALPPLHGDLLFAHGESEPNLETREKPGLGIAIVTVGRKGEQALQSLESFVELLACKEDLHQDHIGLINKKQGTSLLQQLHCLLCLVQCSFQVILLVQQRRLIGSQRSL